MLRQIAMQRSIIVIVACGTSTVSGPCSYSLAMLSKMVGSERRMNGCSNRSSSYRCLHNSSENNDATRNGCNSHLNSLQSSQPSQGGSSSSSSSFESSFNPVDFLATVHLSNLKMIATVPLPSEPRHLVRRLLRLLQTPKLSKELTSKQRKQHEQQQQQQTPTAVKTLLDSGTWSTKNGSRRWNPTQAFVLAQCRRAKQEQHQQQQQEQATAETMSSLALLRQYTQLQADLAERARLYQLDTGVEQILSPHESSRRAAARAGLLLPITKDPFQ